MPQPSILKADLLDGAELNINALSETATRTFILQDLIVTPGDESAALYSALTVPNFPTIGSNHPDRPDILLYNINIKPLDCSRARLTLFYQKPQYNGASAYIIEDDTSLQSYSSAFVPGTRELISVGYDSTLDSNSGPQVTGDITPTNVVVPTDRVEMEFLRPVRTINITQLIIGRPRTSPSVGQILNGLQGASSAGQSISQSVGFVNDGYWQGLPAGYWLMTRYRSEVSRFDGYYKTMASAFTLGNEDWAKIGILFNTQTGKGVPVSDATAKQIRTQQYKYGVTKLNGVVIVGPYPPVNFTSLFGFN